MRQEKDVCLWKERVGSVEIQIDPYIGEIREHGHVFDGSHGEMRRLDGDKGGHVAGAGLDNDQSEIEKVKHSEVSRQPAHNSCSKIVWMKKRTGGAMERQEIRWHGLSADLMIHAR